MSFDLNIKNYKKRELEDIFELPSIYDKFMVERKEIFLKETIIADKTIKEDMKNKTCFFLKQIRELLLSDLNNVSQKLSHIYNTDLKLQDSAVTMAGNTALIDRPVTPYGQSFPSEFYAGVINPLKKRTIRQHLNIDTRFRDNYLKSSASNFQFELPMTFNDVLSIQLDAFEFTSLPYNISASLGNNFFSIELNSTELYTIILENGIYTIPTLILELNTKIALVPELNDPLTCILVASESFGRCIFTNTVSSGYKFTLFFNKTIQGNNKLNIELPLQLGWILGFRLEEYTDNTTYTSEGTIDLYGSKYIYLVLDDYNNSVNNGFFSAFNSSILNKNILGRISMSLINNNSALIQNNLTLITYARQYFGPVNIRKLNIQLMDEFGRQIDTHNMDYSFCVTFNIVYDL